MKKSVGIWIIVLSSFSVRAQFPFFSSFDDSIHPGYRISGSFDSTDCFLGKYQTSLPTQHSVVSNLFSRYDTYFSSQQRIPSRFSAIPHVGLSYSMGSKATQQAGISYTQRIDTNAFIQFNYRRNSSAGFLRNGSLENNNVQLRFQVNKNRWVSVTSLFFDGQNRGLNGGVLNDSIDISFPLEFQEVTKENAETTQRNCWIKSENYIAFLSDSLLKIGLYLSPQYSISNQRYQEIDTLPGLYGVVNYDSTTTNDYWERASFGGATGLFFHTPTFSVNAGLQTTYWDYDNLIRHSDTTEIAFSGDASAQLSSKFSLKSTVFVNLAGAVGEQLIQAELKYKNRLIQVGLSGKWQRNFPNNVQRSYYANNIDYSWNTKQLVHSKQFQVYLNWDNRLIPIVITSTIQQFSNFPFFVQSEWRQDTLPSVSLVNSKISANFKRQRVFVQPSIQLQSSTLNFLPNLTANLRVGFNGGLFKAKKLKAAIGFDLGYISSYQLLDYLPLLDTYVLPNTISNFTAMPKIHVFSQFDLGFFRWFIRVENIEQVFLSTVNRQTIGYPVVPLQLRFGVSWDLFN